MNIYIYIISPIDMWLDEGFLLIITRNLLPLQEFREEIDSSMPWMQWQFAMIVCAKYFNNPIITCLLMIPDAYKLRKWTEFKPFEYSLRHNGKLNKYQSVFWIRKLKEYIWYQFIFIKKYISYAITRIKAVCIE